MEINIDIKFFGIVVAIVAIFMSIFMKVPTTTKVMLLQGSDAWGITESLGRSGKEWPSLYEKNKAKVAMVEKYNSDPEGYAMAFFKEGSLLTLPDSWRVEEIKGLFPRMEITRGPHTYFWVWVFNKFGR